MLIYYHLFKANAYYRVAEYSLGKPKPRLGGPGHSVAIEPYAGVRHSDIIVKVDVKGGG